MDILNLFLWTMLLVGVGGMLYVFYKLLASGLKALISNDD